MMSLHRGKFVVVHPPIFKFSYRPSEFSPRGKFLPKITVFGDFWGHKATF